MSDIKPLIDGLSAEQRKQIVMAQISVRRSQRKRSNDLLISRLDTLGIKYTVLAHVDNGKTELKEQILDATTKGRK